MKSEPTRTGASQACPRGKIPRVVPTLLAAVVTILAPTAAMAESTLMLAPLGQNLVHGGTSHPNTVHAANANPASPAAADRRGYWFGLGALSMGYELGSLDNIGDRIVEVEDTLEEDFATLADAEAAKEELEALIRDLGRDAYFKMGAAATPPLMPLGGGMPGLGGQFSIGVGAVGGARVRILDAPVEVESVDNRYELQSRTSGYLKGAGGNVLSLGYSAAAMHHRDGTLLAGMRLNHYRMELAKSVVAIEDDDEEDFDDALEDDFDRNQRSDSTLGVDLGLVWKAGNYQLGGTLRNVNEPSLRYPRLGRNCNALDGAAATNCHTAASFGDRISLSETHTLERQLQLEGAVFTTNRDWSLSAGWDVNAARDITGDANQWYSISGAWAGRGWWIPGARLGYRANRSGSELDFITGGLTFFRILNLDAAVSRDAVEEDGDEIPRSAMLSLSLEFQY